MGKLGRSNRLYMICLMIFAACVSACKDDSSSGGNGGSQNIRILANEVKKFQLIRTELEGTTPTQAEPRHIENPFTSLSGPMYLSDRLWATAVPEDLTLKGSLTCTEKLTAEAYTHSFSVPFSEPVAIARLLPGQVLFRPHDKSGDSLTCTFHEVFLEDNSGNRFMARTTNASRDLEILSRRGQLDLKFAFRGQEVLGSADEVLAISKAELEQSAKVWSYQQQDYDFAFDAFEIECSTFRFRQSIASTNTTFFQDLNLRSAQMKPGFESRFYNHYSAQDCRIFVFAEGQLRGLSPYFRLINPEVRANTRFEFSGPGHYGTGFGATGFFADTEYATWTIENPFEHFIGISFRTEELIGQAQFVGYNRPPGVQHAGLIRSHIKQLIPKVLLTRGDGSQNVFFPEDLPQLHFALEPFETVTVQLLLNAESCSLWRATRSSFRPSHHDSGMLGVFGLLLEATSPELQAYQVSPGPPNADTDLNLVAWGGEALEPTSPRPAVSQATNNPVGFLYSTNNNSHNWQQNFAWPQDEWLLRSPGPQEYPAVPVCSEASEFFQ